jgi:TRAP-type C4-dicarboxylate transport system permease small subunit
MSHGVELDAIIGTPANVNPPLPEHPAVARLAAASYWFNCLIIKVSMVAMIFTALILTYSVVSRYFFKIPTDWQDEASVFMLIGVTFFSAAYVQSFRGHIGIEFLSSILPAKINALRLLLVDVISCAFCGFFSWKSWTLFHEAWVDGQTTSSTFAPPLWIPYAMMALGMSLLSLQIVLQILAMLTQKKHQPATRRPA